MSISPKEYRAYHDAKQRCNNKNHPRYLDWGGRGITMGFSSYEEFYNEIGKAPEGFSLDRIDNNLGYCVGNVQWASRTKQQLNKRVSKHNTRGITGVRDNKSKGVATVLYQSYINIGKQFIQLYFGPDYFEACCARKSKENKLNDRF